MGVKQTKAFIVRPNTVVRLIISIILILWFGIGALATEFDRTYVVAALLTVGLIYSTWQELMEQAAHMAHHMPHKHEFGPAKDFQPNGHTGP